MLNLIVAVANNNVIGLNGEMPWQLPADLQYFKRITMGHPIIMGRKTFDSIGRALPGRQNIVVTRNLDWQHPGVDVAHTLTEAVSLAGEANAFVIGGALLYQEALAVADRLYITVIHADVAGDTFFPAVNMTTWQEVTREHHVKDDKNCYDIDFTVLIRG